jgi:hypothetical protein
MVNANETNPVTIGSNCSGSLVLDVGEICHGICIDRKKRVSRLLRKSISENYPMVCLVAPTQNEFVQPVEIEEVFTTLPRRETEKTHSPCFSDFIDGGHSVGFISLTGVEIPGVNQFNKMVVN